MVQWNVADDRSQPKAQTGGRAIADLGMPCQRNTLWQRGLRGSWLGVMTGVSAVAVCALKDFGMRARPVHSFCVIIAVILVALALGAVSEALLRRW